MIGFAGSTTYPLGVICPSVVLGEGWKTLRTKTTFIVVNPPISYNAILKQNNLNPNRIVTSTLNQNMKFPTPHEIGEVRGD